MRRMNWLLALAVAVALSATGAGAQATGAISGVVIDQQSRQPVAGAQVRVAGTNLGALANQQGRFVLNNVPAGTQVVQASRLGYQQASVEVQVGSTPATVTLELQVDVLGLDEVVVVGYGVQKRRNVTGSISSIEPEGMEEIPAPSVDNVLQGRMSGVQVTQNSGNPGAAISVRVRGASSISAGNQPLYVIDGVPITQGNYSPINYGGQDVDALADLNPNEIESIEVLKDASAAAIYGSRASNGVVLITTKRGSAGKPQISFNSYYGVQRDYNRVQYLNSDQYIQVKNEGLNARYGLEDYLGYADDGVENSIEVERGTNTDWIDQVLRPAPIYSVGGSISGGDERTRYYVSGTQFSQDGMVRGFGYERLNGRLNLDYSASDKLSLGTNIALTRGITQRAAGDNTIFGPFANATANPPIYPVYDENGEYFMDTPYANPVGLSIENHGEERSVRILGNAFAQYDLFEGVYARASVGLDQMDLRSRRYNSPVIGPAVGSNGEGTVANSFVNKLVYEGTLNWLRDYGDHSLSGVVGTSYEQNSTERNYVTGSQFPSEYFRYLESAASITGGSSSLSEWSLLSYFSRLSYTYADRYTATFNVRADGSSRFGRDNRFGVFPSASLLWRVIDEPWMQDQGLLSNLALRVSYGRTGNQQQIGNFAALGLFEGGANYQDEPGIAPSQLANPALQWETTDQFNLGGDIAFLDDRLSFSADYYIKTTNDLLLARPVPTTTGFSSIWSNIGAMQNRGVELSTRAQLVRGEADGLNWTVDLNVSRNENTVTQLYNDEPIMGGWVNRIEVGQPLGVFYGYKTDGIFQTAEDVDAHAFQNGRTAPGDIRFQDLNEDGVINSDDRTVLGSPWPDFVGGLTNTLAFRGVDLSVFLQYSYGNEIFNANRWYTDQYGSYWDNHSVRALDRWTPENPDATEPRAIWGDPNGNTRSSDRFLEDGSFVRVKNAVLGYTVPNEIASRMGFSKLRVYVQGQNLLTLTDYSGYDPEVNFSGNSAVTRGVDFYTLPQARTLTAGVNLGF